jgi:hypothetical protein
VVVDSQATETPSMQSETAPSFKPTVLPPLVAFVVAGLLGPLYSNEPFDVGLTAWQAVVSWPIGLLVVGLPVLVLLSVRTTPLLRLGQIAIGVLGVISIVATTRSDDAQAGLWFIYPPVLGSVLALGIVSVDGWLRRR